MTGVLVGDRTYARLHRGALRRRDLAPQLAQRAADCFPGLIVSHVDLIKYYEGDEFTVDVTFLDLPAQRWWTGAVVTSIDDFVTDVAFPLTWMRRVNYLTEEIEAIVSDLRPPDRDAAAKLVSEVQPLAVAFVSNPMPEWFSIAHNYEGQLAVMEAFVSEDRESVLRINGEVPTARGILVGRCRALPGARHIAKVIDVELGAGSDHECSVEWENEHLTWNATPIDGATLLNAPGIEPNLPANEDLFLYELAPNRYVLHRQSEEHN